jgi:CHAT domain-containing protein
MNRSSRWWEACLCLFACMIAPAIIYAQTAKFVSPPRTIADITAILDREKPDAARAAKMRAEADAPVPNTRDDGALAHFYFSRAEARALVGRTRDAIADCEKAIELGGGFSTEESRYHQFLSNQYSALGDFRRVIEINQALARNLENANQKGGLFAINLRIVGAFLSLDDLKQAEAYVRKSQSLLKQSKAWKNRDTHGTFFEAYTEAPNADLLFRRGRYREAELAFHKSQILLRDAIVKSASWPNPPLKDGFQSKADLLLMTEGMAKQAQGRLAEAEVDIRAALLNRLRTVGKFHASTARIARVLGSLLSAEGRFAEAEQTARSSVEIYKELGYREDVEGLALALNDLASIIVAQGRWTDAADIYAGLDDATRDWEPSRRDRIRLHPNRIFTYYYTGKVQDGIALARALVASKERSVGNKHVDFAMAQAALGAGLVYAHRDVEALQSFDAALPVLLAYSRDDEDDSSVPYSFDRALQRAIQPYISLLSRTRDAAGSNAAEGFRIGELVRGRSVQRALAASSARAAAGDPALADRLRKKQDLEKEIGAQVGMLNNELALPPEERDSKVVADLRNQIEKLRTDNAKAKQEIDRRFPKYADLANPKPPTVEDVKNALRADEALLSFYFGSQSSFVWVVRKDGPIAFAQIKENGAAIEEKVKQLRASFESEAATVAEIPPFDLVLANQLYQLLLEPVESAWKPAKNLIVVSNGALGTLPLSLLPTAPASINVRGPMFMGYRDVPWLARTHAVTMLPSASALLTLRSLPTASASREKMIGFGDPIFSKEQAREAARQPIDEPIRVSTDTTRGVPLKLRSNPQLDGVDRAELALLPRLPDTAEELKSIALALSADPSKVLHLGITANEQTVKSTNLANYKIIVFATHGLAPGELEGLTQPALALSAPDVASVPGDGLLTMEEILGLKLNADWVVLSACNTGAASGAGAEAASGLGRAFFYAGTRAILVTNWSVHSQSARELVTDLFHRQAVDPALTRGEALRQSMIALMDGKGFTDEKGETVFTYAHPMFWAPYSIIGDGG